MTKETQNIGKNGELSWILLRVLLISHLFELIAYGRQFWKHDSEELQDNSQWKLDIIQVHISYDICARHK